MYLQELATWLGNRKILLVIDGAGWHKAADLVVPGNIKIIHLPPYSPELNPIERLWLHIKDNVLKNILYETLEILETNLYSFINKITTAEIMSICNVTYMSYYL